MTDWTFEHSVTTNADREEVWTYMSDMSNYARLEPGVKRIELDGPFATGTTGRTVAEEFTQEFELTDVVEGERFVITGYTPEGDGSLSFGWQFEEAAGGGTCLTQRITATGKSLSAYEDELRGMEENAPRAMARLADELDRLARSSGRHTGSDERSRR